MVCVMVCMKKIMAVFMQMGNGTAFSMFALRPMIVCMKIVIMHIVGILIMVMAVAMGSGMVIVVIERMGIIAVCPVIFLTMVMPVIITMFMFIMGINMVGLSYLSFLTFVNE